MTRQEFESKWNEGRPVNVTMNCDQPDRNFQTFPEDVTGEHESGEFYGVHFSFEDREEFYADYTTCVFPLDVVGDLGRRKQSHGENVYLVKMEGDEKFPVLEVENGNEYRAKTFCCKIRKI